MTPADLRAWQQAMGYSLTTGAEALGINRATFARLLASEAPIDRRTALACSALAAGLGEWVPGPTSPASPGSRQRA